MQFGFGLVESLLFLFYLKVACNSTIVTTLLRLYFVPNPAIEAMCQKAEPSNKLPNDTWPSVPIVSKSGLVLHGYLQHHLENKYWYFVLK